MNVNEELDIIGNRDRLREKINKIVMGESEDGCGGASGEFFLSSKKVFIKTIP